MTTWHSAILGIRSSGAYFVSTFMFGVMFGLTAAAVGMEGWQAMQELYIRVPGQFQCL